MGTLWFISSHILIIECPLVKTLIIPLLLADMEQITEQEQEIWVQVKRILCGKEGNKIRAETTF